MEQSTETADESMVVVCRAGQSAKLALGAKYNSIGFLRRRLQFPYSLSLGFLRSEQRRGLYRRHQGRSHWGCCGGGGGGWLRALVREERK